MLTAWQLQRASQSFKNTTSDTIPPYACMELDYFNESGISANEIVTDTQNLFWRIKKPTSSAVEDSGRVVFNGPTQVGPNGYGEFQVAGFLLAAFDSVDGALAPGEQAGPKSGSWYLTKEASMFPFVSYDSGRALYESSEKRSIWIRAAAASSTTGEFYFDVEWQDPNLVKRTSPSGSWTIIDTAENCLTISPFTPGLGI